MNFPSTEVQNFILSVKHIFPNFFNSVINVIDLNDNRDLFHPEANYIKLDQLADVIIATSTNIYNIRDMTKHLKAGGLLLFTSTSLTSQNIPSSIYYQKYYFETTQDKVLCFWGIRNKEKFDLTMDDIYTAYKSDKASYHHNYTQYYPTYLEKFKFLPGVKVLEIGVFGGNSIKATRQYLNNADGIIGIDDNVTSKIHESIKDNIYIEIGNINDPYFLFKVNQQYGPFDIVIDDGSHIIDHIIIAFEILFPLLKNNGIYIIEDTACMRDLSTFRISKHLPDHISYFAKYLHFLNQWNIQNENYKGDKPHCVDPDKIDKKTSNPFEYGIDSIHYGVSHIVISKKIRKNWVL
jgi:hypothetical protein